MLVEQLLPRREVHRPAVVRIDQAEVPQLGALIEVRHARRGPIFSATCASELIIPLPATRRGSGRNVGTKRAAPAPVSTRSTNRDTADSYSSFGVSQLVWSLASLTALIM